MKSKGGAGCLIPFGLVFCGIGLIVTFAIAKSFLADVKTRSWAETPAEILKCEINADISRGDNPFQMDVDYRYNFQGSTYTSSVYARDQKWTDNYEKLALKRASYKKGDGAVVCYVNPDAPTEAILQRVSLWSGLFILIPLVFVLIGGTIAAAGIISLRKQKQAKASPAKPLAISAKAKSGKLGHFAGALFCFIFFAVGLGVLFPLGIIPYKKAKAAKSWVETPCTIVWSRVLSHRNDDGTTYSVDIFYEYEFNAEQHRSNKYNYFSGSSSGRDSKSAVVKRYPKGSKHICYVDPEQPERAIIERGFKSIGLWFLIPAAFMFIGGICGVGILINAFRKKDTRPQTSRRDTALAPPLGQPDLESRILRPAKGRLAGVLILLFVALFWNGIISIFVVNIISDFKSSSSLFNILPMLFMIPFVIIGSAMIFFLVHQILGLFNPKLEITLTPGQPRLGDLIRLEWTMSGSCSRLRSLKIMIVGTESATYRRGTTTSTDSDPFYLDILLDETNTLAFYKGSAEFQLPYDLMYSFKTDNNAIEWEIRVKGEIKPGPDFDDKSKIEIFPPASQS